MGVVLAIRCSSMDRVNPITELDRVIDNIGWGWFGKYGQPIPETSIRKKGEIFVVLVGNYKVRVNGTGAHYKLEETSSAPPSQTSHYPAYYADKLDRIGSWLKLAPAAPPDVDLSTLLVRSSRQPLRRALNNSMRGHFWCTTND